MATSPPAWSGHGPRRGSRKSSSQCSRSVPASLLLRSTLGAVLVAALLAALTGCGSSGDSASDARRDVETAVRQGLTQNDPAFCTDGATLRFLTQLNPDADNPVRDCRIEATLPGEPSAREVRFESIRVTGGHAETTVAETGGADDGNVIHLQLVKDGARWKFDRLADIEIDRGRFDTAGEKDLQAYGVTAREASCAMRRVRRFYDTDQLERAILKGESEGFAAAEAICLERESLVSIFKLIFRKGAPKDLPGELVDCVSRRIIEGASTPLLRALFVAPAELDGFEGRAMAAAAKACAKDAEAGLLPAPVPS